MAGLLIGDVVQVNKDDAGMNWIRRAELIAIPACEGDMWGFLDLDTGCEVYSNERFTIYKPKADAAIAAQRKEGE